MALEQRKVVGLDYGVYTGERCYPESDFQKSIQQRRSRDHSLNTRIAFKYLCAILIVLSILLGESIYINNQGIEIRNINKEINTLEFENRKMLSDISLMASLENIEKIAIKDYNMVRPSEVEYLRK